MGLLDDAIREHLDLKRARGSDPAEIEKMEREALGPVRREPTIGSARFEVAEEHAPLGAEGGYPDDRDQLLDGGYHDSTAPHSHGDPYYEHDDPFDARPPEPEQPKRRFLRRNRPTSLSEPAPPEPGFHEDPDVDPHGMLEHDDLLAHHEPLGHDQLGQHHESLAHHDLHQHNEAPAHDDLHEQSEPRGQDDSPVRPPHLQFDHPPKRPRFSTEPPSLQPEADDEPATGTHEPVGATPAAEPEHPGEVQETTEFDVQKHIAETRFQPDPPTQAQPLPEAPEPGPDPPAGDAEAEEDVLEETPEFLQDTPEHDRLWFEQRPPRDFDFDG